MVYLKGAKSLEVLSILEGKNRQNQPVESSIEYMYENQVLYKFILLKKSTLI